MPLASIHFQLWNKSTLLSFKCKWLPFLWKKQKQKQNTTSDYIKERKERVPKKAPSPSYKYLLHFGDTFFGTILKNLEFKLYKMGKFRGATVPNVRMTTSKQALLLSKGVRANPPSRHSSCNSVF